MVFGPPSDDETISKLIKVQPKEMYHVIFKTTYGLSYGISTIHSVIYSNSLVQTTLRERVAGTAVAENPTFEAQVSPKAAGNSSLSTLHKPRKRHAT